MRKARVRALKTETSGAKEKAEDIFDALEAKAPSEKEEMTPDTADLNSRSDFDEQVEMVGSKLENSVEDLKEEELEIKTD